MKLLELLDGTVKVLFIFSSDLWHPISFIRAPLFIAEIRDGRQTLPAG